MAGLAEHGWTQLDLLEMFNMAGNRLKCFIFFFFFLQIKYTIILYLRLAHPGQDLTKYAF